MFLENRFEKLIDRVSASATIPLRVELWNGQQFCLSPKPTVTVVVPKPSALRYFIPPDLNKLGEAFVEGHIRAEGSIHELFRVAESLARSVAATTRAGFGRIRRHSHSHSQDRKAIEYHYDVSNEFYSLFLDRNMVYSCAYYRSENDSLETAQEQKLDHILNKLMLKPGERFLDIGCGWGALIVRGETVRRHRNGNHAIEKSVRVRPGTDSVGRPAGSLYGRAARLPGPAAGWSIRQDRERWHVRARGFEESCDVFQQDLHAPEGRRPGVEPRHHEYG